ncbi:hypothetical protein DKX38_018342 [Salix brachista]|uniref:NB-ARC domain-containing protein n=1 Tax=Salix brachista TaxID=2182728 RepID=A0A5N5KMR6_9ROSI|nr:hypothetical protein DKX38_018342 [Salix brachista]
MGFSRNRSHNYRDKFRNNRYNSRDQSTSSSLICQDQHSQRPPQAFLAARQSSATHEWHPDTGATHHLTNDSANIQLPHEDLNGSIFPNSTPPPLVIPTDSPSSSATVTDISSPTSPDLPITLIPEIDRPPPISSPIAQAPPNTHPMITRSKNNVHRPNIRDEEKEKTIQLLLHPSDEENISLLPIVGINGGMGKTTLAKMAYNNERVVKHFQFQNVGLSIQRLRQEMVDGKADYISATGGVGFGEDNDFRDLYSALQFEILDAMHDLALSVAQDECFEVTANSITIDKSVQKIYIADPDSVIRQYFPSLSQDLDQV